MEFLKYDPPIIIYTWIAFNICKFYLLFFVTLRNWLFDIVMNSLRIGTVNFMSWWNFSRGFAKKLMIAWLSFVKSPAPETSRAKILDFFSTDKKGIFIVPRLLWHGTSVFAVSSEGPLPLVVSYNKLVDILRTHPNQDPNRIYMNGQRVLIQLII